MKLIVDFPTKFAYIPVQFGEIYKVGTGEESDIEIYNGPYSVTPAIIEQTLETARKMMTANMKVKEIPYAEVSNTANGITATIGNEVLIYGN